MEKDGTYIKNKVGKFSFSLKIIKEQKYVNTMQYYGNFSGKILPSQRYVEQ